MHQVLTTRNDFHGGALSCRRDDPNLGWQAGTEVARTREGEAGVVWGAKEDERSATDAP